MALVKNLFSPGNLTLKQRHGYPSDLFLQEDSVFHSTYFKFEAVAKMLPSSWSFYSVSPSFVSRTPGSAGELRSWDRGSYWEHNVGEHSRDHTEGGTQEPHNIGLAIYLQRTGKLYRTTLPLFKNLQSIEWVRQSMVGL